MKRLQKLTNLINYFSAFRAPGLDVAPIRVVDQAHATNRLSRKSGVQILIARPELQQDGNSDSYTLTYSTCIFVLEKSLGVTNTDEREDDQFLKLTDIASEILTVIENDTTSCRVPEMCGLSLESVNIIPEASIFGGWNGYSIELSFR